MNVGLKFIVNSNICKFSISFISGYETPRKSNGRRYIAWSTEDNEIIRKRFRAFISGTIADKCPKADDMKKFLRSNRLITLQNFDIKRQLDILRTKLINERKRKK